MVDANVRASDPRNYELDAKVSLWFRKFGSSLEKDWKEVGNVNNAEFAPKVTRLDHMSNRRGVRAKDLTLITERAGTLSLVIDEINLHNLQYAFSAPDSVDLGNVDVHDNKTTKNPGVGLTISLGMTDLVPASLLVRSVGLEEEVTYVENVDYTVDYANGIVTIKAGGALISNDPDLGVPELHLQWAKNVETQSFEVIPGTEVNVEAKLQILTEGGIQRVYHMKNANVSNNGAIKFGDGTKYEEMGLQLEVLEDSDGRLATLHVVNTDEL